MNRFFSLVGKVLAGMFVLIVAGYLLINVGAMMAAKQKRSTVKADLTQRLATAVPAAKGHQAETIAAGSSLGVPARAWIAQDCDFPTSDAGWMVQSYRQACTLTSVTAWQVDSEDAARAAVKQFPETLVGATPDPDRYVGSDCETLTESAAGDSRSVEAVLVKANSDDPYWCGKTYTPGFYHRVIAGTPTPLDQGRPWLVVRAVERLGEVDLGCTHWSILFCGNPFGDDPEFGELPAAR